jgi:hypothetical protein
MTVRLTARFAGPHTDTRTVNVHKGKLWDAAPQFDAAKDKATFRQYEDACDRVKNFYREQHGACPAPSCASMERRR